MPLSAIEPITKPWSMTYEEWSPPDMDLFIESLNEKISDYNTETTPSEQQVLLYEIQQEIKWFDDQLNYKVMAKCPDYFNRIHGDLFEEMYQEQTRLNTSISNRLQAITSTLSGAVNDITASPYDALSILSGVFNTALASAQNLIGYSKLTLTELIANMEPDKIDKLAALLAKKDIDGLKSLYQEGDLDKAAFDAFLATHRVSFLGGGNSLNFKVENIETGEEQVLKLEYRMGQPRHIETMLRATTLNSAFIPIHAERQALFNHQTQGPIAKTIQVLDYCPAKDLQSYCASKPSGKERVDAVLPLFHSMADLLTKMQDANCGFPDMKSSNWLVDGEGNLRIADGKSFLKLNSNGKVEQSKGFICTNYMLAPEMYDRSDFSADAMHVYLLGKNLYHSLTDCSIDDLYNSTNNDSFDFSYPVFQQGVGLEIKALLESMLKKEPNKRPSLAVVQQKLEQLQENPEAVIATKKAQEKALDQLAVLQSIIPNNLQLYQDLYKKVGITTTEQEAIAVENDIGKTINKITEIKALTIDRMVFNGIAYKIDTSIRNARNQDDLEALYQLTNGLTRSHFQEIKKYLSELNQFKVSENDKLLDAYITEAKQKVLNAETGAEIISIHENISRTYNELKAAKPQVDYIKELTSKNKTFMASKANRVMRALEKVPLKERQNLLESKRPEAKRVLDEMAASRTLPKFMSSRTTSNNPADTYKEFKEKFQSIPGADNAANKDEDELEPPSPNQ